MIGHTFSIVEQEGPMTQEESKPARERMMKHEAHARGVGSDTNHTKGTHPGAQDFCAFALVEITRHLQEADIRFQVISSTWQNYALPIERIHTPDIAVGAVSRGSFCLNDLRRE